MKLPLFREFQKHEVLTVEKLEKALTKLDNDSQHTEDAESCWACEKENMEQKLLEKVEINQCSDDMEVTTIVCVSNQSQSESIIEQVDMEVSASSLVQIHDAIAGDCSNSTNKVLPIISLASPDVIKMKYSFSEQISLESTSITIEEVSMPAVEECKIENITECKLETKKESDKTTRYFSTSAVFPEQNKTESKMTCVEISENIYNDHEFPPFQETVKNKIFIPSQDFSTVESSEFTELIKKFSWKMEISENEMVLSKTHNYLILRLKLDYEYHYQNVKHYIVEDIEVDTKKGIIKYVPEFRHKTLTNIFGLLKDMEDKWSRFGLLVLENTLENCNVKGLCTSTQDLPKLLHVVEEYTHSLLEFVLEDSPKFEMLANPRSIKFDTGDSKLTFELSNLENLFWIRITLNLIPVFPLVAKDVIIESILGSVNNVELSNMISTIRPKGLYLTRIAECIEDFLKFRTTSNERKMLDLTHCEK